MRISLVFGMALWLSVGHADEPMSVTLFDADGREVIGELADVSREAVRLTGSPPTERLWSDVVWLRFQRADQRLREPRGAAIWLANGDRLVAKAIGIADEQLLATWQQFPEWPAFKLPLEAVHGLSLSLPSSLERRDEIAAWLLGRKDRRDELRLLNGDRLSGELFDWSEATIRFQSLGSDVKLPSSTVRDVAFNPELLALPPARELCWLVSLWDGSRVTLPIAKCRLDREQLAATHVTGVTWTLPLTAIFELRVLHGRAVYLSDLSPVDARHTPFLPGTREWRWQRDRAVSGRPLRLSGREFPKGLGMHSRSTVEYDLTRVGPFHSLSAIVGLDDTTTGKGTATCAVDLDGKRVFEELKLSRSAGPRKLPLIDLRGAKRLTLHVDFGTLGDSQDHVDWVDAVLLSKKPNPD